MGDERDEEGIGGKAEDCSRLSQPLDMKLLMKRHVRDCPY